MAAFYKWLISMLVWLSADPAAIDAEPPKAAAAVAAARASMVKDAGPAPAPGPAPTSCDCGKTCVRGVWKPDGRIEQRCGCKCPRCEAERAKGGVPCPDGKCPKV